MLILLMLFYSLSCDRASCINGESRAELSSPYEGSCPPLNPMECEKEWYAVGSQQEGPLGEDALRHGQGPLTDVDREEQFTLGRHGDPYPMRGARQALDRLILADVARFEGTEHGGEFVQLHLAELQSVQAIVRKGSQLVGDLDQPLQGRIGIDLEDPRRAPDAQAFGHAADDPYDEVRRGPLPVRDGAEGLQKVAATDEAEQLAPAPPIGMTVSADIGGPGVAAEKFSVSSNWLSIKGL